MIDLDELRQVAHVVRADLRDESHVSLFNPSEHDVVFEAIEEIERLRASELALKKEIIEILHDWNSTGYVLVENEIGDNERRIKQLEQEIQESES